MALQALGTDPIQYYGFCSNPLLPSDSSALGHKVQVQNHLFDNQAAFYMRRPVLVPYIRIDHIVAPVRHRFPYRSR